MLQKIKDDDLGFILGLSPDSHQKVKSKNEKIRVRGTIDKCVTAVCDNRLKR
jgi:hypothetical protein